MQLATTLECTTSIFVLCHAHDKEGLWVEKNIMSLSCRCERPCCLKWCKARSTLVEWTTLQSIFLALKTLVNVAIVAWLRHCTPCHWMPMDGLEIQQRQGEILVGRAGRCTFVRRLGLSHSIPTREIAQQQRRSALSRP